MTQIHIHFVQLERPYSFTSPVLGADSALWIVANEATLTHDEHNEIAPRLVAWGCRFAFCSDHDRPLLDEVVDWAYPETCENGWPDDETTVDTTWHENEPIAVEDQRLARTVPIAEPSLREYVVVAVGAGPDGLRAVEESRECIALSGGA